LLIFVGIPTGIIVISKKYCACCKPKVEELSETQDKMVKVKTKRASRNG
jgi:hypothetical protein